MSLSPRAIALQGFGFAALLIATQGFSETKFVLAIDVTIDMPSDTRYVVFEDSARLFTMPTDARVIIFEDTMYAFTLPEQTGITMPVSVRWITSFGDLT